MTIACRRHPFSPRQLLAGVCLALAAAGGASALDSEVQVKLPYNLAYKLQPIDIEFIVKDAAPGLLEDFKRMRWLDGAEDKSDSQRSHPSSAIGYAVSQLLPIR